MLERSSPVELAPQRPMYDDEIRQDGFDLREWLSFAWRQWKFIAAIVGLSVLVTAVYVLKQTPLYTASALILLDNQPQKSPMADSDVRVDLTLPEVASQIAIIKSVSFLKRAVEKENLTKDPEF